MYPCNLTTEVKIGQSWVTDSLLILALYCEKTSCIMHKKMQYCARADISNMQPDTSGDLLSPRQPIPFHIDICGFSTLPPSVL